METDREYEIQINGEHFYINKYDGGWAWWTAKDEMDGYADNPLEAMQNAIDYVHNRIVDEEEAEEQRLNDEKYGTYEEQVQKLYDDTRL